MKSSIYNFNIYYLCVLSKPWNIQGLKLDKSNVSVIKLMSLIEKFYVNIVHQFYNVIWLSDDHTRWPSHCRPNRWGLDYANCNSYIRIRGPSTTFSITLLLSLLWPKVVVPVLILIEWTIPYIKINLINKKLIEKIDIFVDGILAWAVAILLWDLSQTHHQMLRFGFCCSWIFKLFNGLSNSEWIC